MRRIVGKMHLPEYEQPPKSAVLPDTQSIKLCRQVNAYRTDAAVRGSKKLNPIQRSHHKRNFRQDQDSLVERQGVKGYASPVGGIAVGRTRCYDLRYGLAAPHSPNLSLLTTMGIYSLKLLQRSSP